MPPFRNTPLSGDDPWVATSLRANMHRNISSASLSYNLFLPPPSCLVTCGISCDLGKIGPAGPCQPSIDCTPVCRHERHLTTADLVLSDLCNAMLVGLITSRRRRKGPAWPKHVIVLLSRSHSLNFFFLLGAPAGGDCLQQSELSSPVFPTIYAE